VNLSHSLSGMRHRKDHQIYSLQFGKEFV